MAFMSMFIVMLFFIITLIGLGILIIGIVLDVIWGVRKKKKKKVNIVLKIFAVFLTVVGVLTAAGPISAVGIMVLGTKISNQKEINQFDASARVYMDNVQDMYDEGFDFKGVHYVKCDQMHPQTSHENCVQEEVGIMIDDNNQRIIYSFKNTSGIEILDVEYSSGVFVEESNIQRMLDYYENDAPLYVEIHDDRNNDGKKIVKDIDSEHVRKIRDRVIAEGQNLSYGDPGRNRDGYLLIYSTDDMYCIDMNFDVKGDEIMMSSGSSFLLLTAEDPDAAFMISLIDD